MKLCQGCSRELADNVVFCGGCGAKVQGEVATEKESGDRFCHKCGERIPRGFLLCPNCGVNTQTRTTAVGGKMHSLVFDKRLPKWAVGIIAVAALAVVVVGVVALAGKLLQSPADKFVAYQKSFLVEKYLENLVGGIDQYNNFSSDMRLSAEVNDPELNDYLDGSYLDLKLNTGNHSMLLNAEVTVMGSSLLSGTLSGDADVLGFQLPQADPAYYTMDMGSLFANNKGLLDEWDALQLYSGYYSLTSENALTQIPADTLNKLGKLYLNVILGAVNEENVTVANKKKIRLPQLGKRVEATLYVFQPTAEDVEEMLHELANTIEEDEDLHSYFTTSTDYILMQVALYTQGRGDDPLADVVDYIRDNARSMGYELEREGFTWTLGVADGRVCLQEVGLKEMDDYVIYESWGDEKTGRRDAVYRSLDSDWRQGLSCNWTKKGSTYNGTLEMFYRDSTEIRFDFTDMKIDKRSVLGIPYGRYEVRATDGSDEKILLDVAPAKGGGSDHVLQMVNIYPFYYSSFDESMDEWIKVTLHTSDKRSSAIMPEGEAIDISNYSRDELELLIYQIAQAVNGVLSDLTY